jgi:hypothetical protein
MTPFLPANNAGNTSQNNGLVTAQIERISPTPTIPISLTQSHRMPLQIQPLEAELAETDATVQTLIHVLIYYDANNDRAPSPNEGIPNVLVMAVDGQGQPLAQLFTNQQGEAQFQVDSPYLSRLIVPFVPAWSARLRLGVPNEDIQLGLPAVRLPIFLPIKQAESTP